MVDKTNVLIFPAGSENALDIYDSLKYNLHFDVFGASGKSDHAEFRYPQGKLFVGDLYITSDTFVHNFNKVICDFGISYVIPTHDTIAVYLKKYEDRIKAKIVCSPYETARIAENKMLTFSSLEGCPYLPMIYPDTENVKLFPVFLKPHIGAGSKGTFVARNHRDLDEIVSKNSNLVICEYLPGDEFTVDCFTNRKGELLFCGPRVRARVDMGISFRSERVPDDTEFRYIAEDLNSKLEFRGAWFFQVKRNAHGELRLLEFSVRQAGTMAYFRQLGVNFAALSLFDAMDHDVSVLFNDYDLVLDRSLRNCYQLAYRYDTLYIDFDDTLIVNGKVNTTLMTLIYQSFNQNRRVILLTKHLGDIEESLSKYRIYKGLFDDIILVEPSARKADFVTEKNSIFIDNHFPERLSVSKEHGIPVFDVDAVECLLDYSAV